MALVIVQPARNPEAKRNYRRTVDSPVSLDEARPYLNDDDWRRLSTLHPAGRVPLWGTTAGERGQLRTRWSRISTGDTVLFTGKGEVFKVARVTHKFRSAPLADTLWKPKITANQHVASWEYMYAFNQPLDVAIPYASIQESLLGLPFPTREFSVLSPSQSAPILAYLEQNSQEPPLLPTASSTRTVLREFDEFDSVYTGKHRTEQAYLRQFLLGEGTGTCALCGRAFSPEMLIAAHIKKRSLCDPHEKADIPAIAMLACRFGCDELFERGMITVDEVGKITQTRRLLDAEAKNYFRERLAGRTIKEWDSRQDSRKYYSAHRTFWS